MESFDVIFKRYSVRKFKDQDIPTDDLKKIIQAAGSAPSGKNVQNWHFVVIKNRSIINQMVGAVDETIAEIAAGLPSEKGEKFKKFSRFATFFGKAPVVVAVYAGEYIPEGYHELLESNAPKEKTDRLLKADPCMQSVGAAVENLILAAFDMGYGSCWMTSPNHSGDKFEKIIGFEKEGYLLSALVPIGVPEGDKKSPPKKNVEEIMTILE